MRTTALFLLTSAVAIQFTLPCSAAEARPTVEKAPFGSTSDGQQVEVYTLRNSHGLTAKVLTFGAAIYSLEVPDRDAKMANVNANRPGLADYEAKGGAFGSVIGRYANRIGGASFTIDGVKYSLAANNGPNHIHGGPKGFTKRVWKAEPAITKDAAALKLTYTSADGEEGYPGKLTCTLTYELNDRNEWKMDYTANTDKATVLNFANHSYWNLGGAYSGTALDHLLTVNADQVLKVDEMLIPTGEFLPVANSPLDFRQPRRVGERIGEIKEKHFNGGYDHCFVIKQVKPGDLTLCAKLEDPKSGRTMEVLTTEPGVQVYSANAPAGANVGPGGYAYPKHAAVCLETQHYPDSPNKPAFPTTLLKPGETFRSTTIHRFGVTK
jgi:aldose 1-epimerase